MATMTSLDPVLKEFYEGLLRETINNKVKLFQHLEQSDKQWSGRRVQFPFRTVSHGGIGARADNGTLPTAGQAGYVLASVSACYNYGRLSVTGPSIASGKNSFLDELIPEMDSLAQDFANDLGRQAWGTGDGRLAQIGVSSTAATGSLNVLVFNRFAEVGQPGAKYLRAGMEISIGSVATPQVATSSQTVSAVTVSTVAGTTTDTVVLGDSAAAFSSTEHFLFVNGAGGLGIEMNGMLNLVDDVNVANWWAAAGTGFASAVMGISRTATTNFNANVLHNSGTARVVDGNLIQQAFDTIHINSGLEPDLIIGDHSVVRAFLDHVSADRRYSSPEFAAGTKSYGMGLSYNGVAIEMDRQGTNNCLFVINKSCLKLFTLLDTSFQDRDGAILSRVANQDAWEAFICRYGNIGIDGNPRGLCRIQDILVD